MQALFQIFLKSFGKAHETRLAAWSLGLAIEVRQGVCQHLREVYLLLFRKGVQPGGMVRFFRTAFFPYFSV